ncbi:uncharacterized protein BcabD6B2_09560 [Babesia caballi]|uniref:CCZ1/INTU/HSP4 first Longin domain-containing protein n=1 Tax=Babesia caballi TaxID=5871 RepID=A0AAV4LNU5_BABCB|nr:hypothetical protein, conserved [Babesia caballi]
MSRVNTIFVFDLNQKPASSNPSDEEVQDAKLLYYYPEHREVEERRSHLGLIEGLIGLLSSFTTHKIDFLRTKLLTTTVSEWCPDVYLVVCFKNEEAAWSEMAEYSHHWKHFITKVVLENAKSIFELLYGPLLERCLPSTYNRRDGAGHSGTAHPYFLLPSQTLIADVCAEFESIKECLITYNKEILYSSLDLDDKLLLYTYLIKNQGTVCKERSYCLKPLAEGEGANEVHIMESEAGAAFGPRIHLKGQEYHLCAMYFNGLLLVLLIQSDNLMLTLTSIKEHLTGMPNGLRALAKSLSQNPSTAKLHTVSLNKATKVIRSIGYDQVDDKALRELQITRGIHHLIESSAGQISQLHVKSSEGWFSSQHSNDRLA